MDKRATSRKKTVKKNCILMFQTEVQKSEYSFSLRHYQVKTPCRRDELFLLQVRHQTLTFTHLVRRQGITLAFKRVFTLFELNTDWRTHDF